MIQYLKVELIIQHLIIKKGYNAFPPTNIARKSIVLL